MLQEVWLSARVEDPRGQNGVWATTLLFCCRVYRTSLRNDPKPMTLGVGPQVMSRSFLSSPLHRRQIRGRPGKNGSSRSFCG